VKASLLNSKHEDLELIFPKGKVVLTQRRYNMIGNISLLVVFNEKDMYECSSDSRFYKALE